MARLDLRPLPLVLRELEVRRITDLAPRLRRITLGGEHLGTRAVDAALGDIPGAKLDADPGADASTPVDGTLPAFSSPGFDDHVKCIFPGASGVPDLPVQLPHGIEWPPAAGRVTRDYTPTRVDPVALEIDLEFVLHETGPASDWARSAAPGLRLHVVGPKMTTVVPPSLDWIVLAGDETAVPAMSRFCRERPTAAAAHFVVLTSDSGVPAVLDTAPGDTVTRLTGDPRDGDLLRRAVADVLPDSGEGYLWAAGESRALLRLRRLVKGRADLDKSRVDITGYWTAAQAEPDVSSASAPSSPRATAAISATAAAAAAETKSSPAATGDSAPTADAVPPTSGPSSDTGAEAPAALPPSPTAWFAVRAALQLGAIDALAEGSRDRDELAAELGIAPDALATLLGVLDSHGIVRSAGTENAAGPVELTPLGETLAYDEHEAEEFLGHHADSALALLGLADSLRTVPADAHRSAWARVHGATPLRATVERPEQFEEYVESASGLSFFASAVAADPAVSRAERVILTGPGAVAVGEVLARELGAAENDGARSAYGIAGAAGTTEATSAPALEIAEQSGTLEVLRRDAARPGAFTFRTIDPTPSPADTSAAPPSTGTTVVSALAVDMRTDAEASTHLESLRALGDTLVVLARFDQDSLNPHAAEHALESLAATGRARTDDAVLAALAAPAWARERGFELGWGLHGVVFSAAR